jgi:hypothetical protein
MAKEIPSVGDVLRTSDITDEKRKTATAVYLNDENAEQKAARRGAGGTPV